VGVVIEGLESPGVKKGYMIKEQVTLPFSIALEITVQGIRIRLGRSMVTLAGVALGIAFLMSVMAGMVIKQGVAEEESIRQNIDRMVNVLAAETGTLNGRVVGVVQVGPVDQTESRLLRRVVTPAVARAVYWRQTDTLGPLPLSASDVAEAASGAFPNETAVLLVVGDPRQHNLAPGWDVPGSATAVACSRREQVPPGVPVILLDREQTAEELQAHLAQRQQARFRTIWIIAISLIVTVIGISNSMLMSVTERFREIGTMKCLGALSSFVRRLFIIESGIIGCIGSVVGCIAGTLFPVLAYGLTYGMGLVLGSMHWGMIAAYASLCFAAGVAISVGAALYPAQVAARMVPSAALRSTI
jgi:hypothetical protein